MEYIKYFESSSNIDSYLKTSIFSELPFNYQRSIVVRAFEVNEDITWSITHDIDWVNDKESVNKLISDYSNTYPHRKFRYGLVPVKILVDRILSSDEFDGIDTVEDFYKWYSGNDVQDHGDSIFPILVDEDEESYVEDGWHRLNHYIKMGYREIPVVSY